MKDFILKYRIPLLVLLFYFFYIFSFPLVIPGTITQVWLEKTFGSLFVLFIMPILIYFADRAKNGWRLFAWVYILLLLPNLAVFYWIFNSLHVYGDLSFSTSIIMMILMIFGETLYWYGFVLLYRFLARRGMAAPHLVAALYVAIETIRAHFPVDFYWNALGHSQYNNPITIQLASIGGIYILSFLIVWVSLLAWSWIRGEKRKKESVVFGVVAILLLFYSIQHRQFIEQTGPERSVKLAFMQPNINQFDVEGPKMTFNDIINVYRDMINAVEDDTFLLIWHEAAFPFRLPKGYDKYKTLWDYHFRRVKYFKRQLVGCDMFQLDGTKFYNSALFVDGDKIAKIYDKIRLAPFGEYLPMSDFFYSIGMSTVVPNSVGSFSRGSEFTVYDYDGLKISPLICFDGTFSENVRGFVNNGADLIINITNDAWFGKSSAAFQHNSFYFFRAVETGRTIVRVANIGVSGYILPDGTAPLQTALFERVLINKNIPVYKIDTFYEKYGNVFLWAMLAYLAIGMLYARIKGKIIS